MTELVIVAPILPGKVEKWRRAIQELDGSRHAAYTALAHSLGLRDTRIALCQNRLSAVALVRLDVPDLTQLLTALAAEAPFPRWLRQQVYDLHGVDLAGGMASTVVFRQSDPVKGTVHMSIETNTNLARRMYEETFNAGNLSVIDEMVTPDFVNHDPGLPPGPTGPEGYKMVVSTIRTAMPDVHFSIEDIVAEGDYVGVRWIARGTQTGEFAGVPPTGKKVQIGGCVIQRIENGKSAEHWASWDLLGLLGQLGAIPGMGN